MNPPIRDVDHDTHSPLVSTDLTDVELIELVEWLLEFGPVTS